MMANARSQSSGMISNGCGSMPAPSPSRLRRLNLPPPPDSAGGYRVDRPAVRMLMPHDRVLRPRRPTMFDVARHAGVSLKTVSRVVNREPSVAQHLVDRVLDAVSQLGFRRNDIAATLRSPVVNRTIGLLIEEMANPFY